MKAGPCECGWFYQRSITLCPVHWACIIVGIFGIGFALGEMAAR